MGLKEARTHDRPEGPSNFKEGLSELLIWSLCSTVSGLVMILLPSNCAQTDKRSSPSIDHLMTCALVLFKTENSLLKAKLLIFRRRMLILLYLALPFDRILAHEVFFQS